MLRGVTTTALALLTPLAGSVALAQTPAEAILQGEFKLALRYRFEHVDDDAFARDAGASTLRTRLTWRSAAWNRWSLLAEADDVHVIGWQRHNDTRNGRSDFPVVADPEGTGLNQAAIQFAGLRYGLVVGRQRINLDDQRFVGGVAWRQNEQTFDAVTTRVRLPRADLQYSYVANVSRPFGPHAGTPPANLGGDTHLLNVRTDVGPLGNLVAFAYLLEFDDVPALSSDTIGLRSTGSHPLAGRTRWVHTVAFAHQDTHTSHRQLELGTKRGNWTLLFGLESLSGHESGGSSFQAPLGTLHLFQGWADKLTTTPPQGIRDRYVTLSGTSGAWKFQVSRHDFDATEVARSLGTELDASLAWQVTRRYEILLKAADFRSEGFARDTRKLWLQVNAAL